MGAVPLKEAKRSRLGKRVTSPVMPMVAAATAGPTPKISVVDVLDAFTTAASCFLESLIWASRRRRASSSSPASPPRGARPPPIRPNRGQKSGRFGGVDLVRHTPRNQLAQQRVQPTGHLVPS